MKIDIATPLARLADALPAIVDDYVGLIGNVRQHPAEIDSPRFFRYNCSAANTEAFGDYRNFAVGGGAATTRDMALAKAIGEAIERYCAAIYDKADLPLFAYADAPVDCIAPSQFVLYSKAQHAFPGFMFDPFLDSSPVRWALARDLFTGRNVHVPAAMVYVPYFFYQDGEETPITQPISTGLSCHCSYEEAAIGALCEVIERDCFMITWQAHLARPRIRPETLSRANRDLLARFEAVGYRVHLVDISNESRVPTVMAVARHGTAFVPLVVAASTALSGEEAVRKALEELAHTERYAFQIKGEIARVPHDPEYDNILGQVDHVNFWVDPAHAPHADFLHASGEWRDENELASFEGATPAASLDVLVRRLHDTGYRALVADITTPDVAELGMRVVRGLIPGYHPLFMGYHNRPLGGERLWRVPQLLGYPGLEAGRDYPFPHPFP